MNKKYCFQMDFFSAQFPGADKCFSLQINEEDQAIRERPVMGERTLRERRLRLEVLEKIVDSLIET